MYDRHNKANDARAMMSVASALDDNISDVPKDQAGLLKRIEVGDMTAIIYKAGEASIGINTKYVDKVVALDPEELRALYDFLKQHYENEEK